MDLRGQKGICGQSTGTQSAQIHFQVFLYNVSSALYYEGGGIHLFKAQQMD